VQNVADYNVADYAEDLAGKVAEQARVYGDKAQKVATAFRPYVEKSMKEQPMATLAVASVIGFVLGALEEMTSAITSMPDLRGWKQ
jgi:ElaB/YqjD/DUF883 family membrane-anchored ribosome-binding protein